MRAMGTDQTMTATAALRVCEFAQAQLVWLSRRGDPQQRRAARALAGIVPRLVDEVAARTDPPPAVADLETARHG